MKPLLFVYLILSLGDVLPIYPQPVTFERYSIEHGLSQSSVFAIAEDYRGFMWFGTQDGLNRFNGYTFTTFRNVSLDSQSLSNSNVIVLLEDKNKNLWIGTANGLNRFNRTKETFERYYPRTTSALIHSGFVRSLYEDHKGILWIGTDDGIFVFDKHRQQIVPATDDQGLTIQLSDCHVRAICEDTHGRLWIGTENGLNVFDDQRKKEKEYLHDERQRSTLTDNFILSIYEDRNNVIWVGTMNGLNRYDQPSETFSAFRHSSEGSSSISHNTVSVLFEDTGNRFWVGTYGGGLDLMSREKETFFNFKVDPIDDQGISANDVLSIFQAKNGVVWIGTQGGGVCKADFDRSVFIHYKHIPGKPNSLGENSLRKIFEDREKRIWIGTDGGGLILFDPAKEIFSTFRNDPANANSLSNDFVVSVCEDSLGYLWIGTRKGLNKFDPRKKSFQRYYHDEKNPKSLSSDIVYVVYFDNTQTLWIGTNGKGVDRFNSSDNSFSHGLFEHQDSLMFIGSTVRTIFQDTKGDLWFGTSTGLSRYTPSIHAVQTMRNDPDNPNSLSGNHITYIHEETSGILWIGTINEGVNRLDLHSNSIRRIGYKDGLSNDAIYGILQDDSLNLWISTNNGITRYSLKTGAVRIYDEIDGLQSKEFNLGACCKSSTGEIYFGGINGLNRIHPKHITLNQEIPAVVFTDFQKFNKHAVLDTAITEKKNLILQYNDNVLTFQFAALNYRKTQKNLYMYKLENFDQEWNMIGVKREATYTNLDPGTYILRVKGSNNDGIWNVDGASLSITILPPWWRTSIAYLVYGIFFTGMVFSLIRYRTLSLQTRNKELEHVVLQRTKELRGRNEELAQANVLKTEMLSMATHDLKNPLTRIILASDLIKEECKNNDAIEVEAKTINSSARYMSDLISEFLDSMALQSGKITLRYSKFDYTLLILRAINSIKPATDQKQQQVKLHYDEAIPYVLHADSERMYQVLENLISNASKFSPMHSQIIISLKNTDTHYQLTVQDEGPGFTKEDKQKMFGYFQKLSARPTGGESSTGVGLTIVKHIIELHHGTLRLESEPGKGSTFIVELPV